MVYYFIGTLFLSIFFLAWSLEGLWREHDRLIAKVREIIDAYNGTVLRVADLEKSRTIEEGTRWYWR